MTTEASRKAEYGSGIRGTGGASPNSAGKVYVSFARIVIAAGEDFARPNR